MEFPEGFGDGEACGHDADEGGPYGLAGQLGDAAGVVVFLEVGEGCGPGMVTALGSRGCQAGIWSLRLLPGKRWIMMESKFPGWSPRPVSMVSPREFLEGDGAKGYPPGAHYRNCWWVTDPLIPLFQATGIHAQSVIVHVPSQTIGVIFAIETPTPRRGPAFQRQGHISSLIPRASHSHDPMRGGPLPSSAR